MAIHRYSIPKFVYYWPLYGLCLSIIGLWLSFYALIPIALFAYFSFRNTLNVLQIIGRVYWITKSFEIKQRFRVSKGFMHTTSYPWYKGNGIHMVFWKRSFQIGICQKQTYANDVEGTLASLQGRFLDLTPRQIREQTKKLGNS